MRMFPLICESVVSKRVGRREQGEESSRKQVRTIWAVLSKAPLLLLDFLVPLCCLPYVIPLDETQRNDLKCFGNVSKLTLWLFNIMLTIYVRVETKELKTQLLVCCEEK